MTNIISPKSIFVIATDKYCEEPKFVTFLT